MKHLAWILLAAMLLGACGQSYKERKQQSRLERMKRISEDSAALKIAVMPTLDCLPLYVAKEYNLFDTLGADIRLKFFTAQMDCDTALAGGSVEGGVTDLVRGQRMTKTGVALAYLSATNAYWQLITNRNARINNLKQLNEKMVAMTRFSATDLLTDYAIDSAKLKSEYVFKVQINDVCVRLDMIRNNEMDAMLLTEPQASVARLQKHKVLMDSRRLDMRLGAIAMRKEIVGDTTRIRQIEVLKKAYNMACDSINKYGIAHYGNLILKQCKVETATLKEIDKQLKFEHIAPPRQADIERADKWLKKND